MRAFLVVMILLLGLSGAAPEPEISLRGDSLLRASRAVLDSLVEIESSTGRGDRLHLASLGPRALRVEVLRPEDRDLSLRLGLLNSEIDAASPDTQAERAAQPQPTSIDNLCKTLFTSAQDNNLPVPFFANLLWQESRLRADDVSKKGAQGIAQFMPKVAVETGLANPFDPMQAIPASARFLQRLRLQFGNLGFVAAAYNAGAHRVIEWLERRASLPRETRDYVVRVTGLSVEAWKTMPIDNDALTFVPRLPCRTLPAFANVEQEHQQQAEAERAKYAAAARQQALVEAAHEPPPASKGARETRGAVREARRAAHAGESSKRVSKHEPKHEVVRVARAGHTAKHEAAHAPHAGREKHRSA